MRDKPVILLVFSNDNISYLKQIGIESNALERLIEPYAKKYELELIIKHYSESLEIIETLNVIQNRLVLFHFSGHSNNEQLNLDQGGLFNKGLSKKLSECQKLKLVFLNGCSNAKIVENIANKNELNVIGTHSKVPDGLARQFSEAFYKNLIDKNMSVELSFMGAKTDLSTMSPSASRSIDLDDQITLGDSNYWFLVKPDNSWKLKDAVHHCNLIPEITPKVLPPKPYKGLRNYTLNDAEIFSGRCKEIYECLEILNNYDEKYLVLHGQSGVGKSSFLQAGLLPRLSNQYQSVSYLRTLEDIIAYHQEKTDHEVLVIDQLESIFFDGADPNFYLSKIINNISVKKVIFCLRTEWCARLETIFQEDLQVSYNRIMLGVLSLTSILEIIKYPKENNRLRKKYRIEFEPDNLPEVIAYEVLRDKESNVAPTLQCVLFRLWEESSKVSINETKVALKQKVFEDIAKKGLMLEDFIDNKIDLISIKNNWGKQAMSNGLLFNVLGVFSNPNGTARSVGKSILLEMYSHIPHIKELLGQFEKNHLLMYLNKDGGNYRLSHDSLAPIILKKVAESNASSQRFMVVFNYKFLQSGEPYNKLYLNEPDLNLYEKSKNGMSLLNPKQSHFLRESQNKNRKKYIVQELFLFLMFLVALFVSVGFLSGEGLRIR